MPDNSNNNRIENDVCVLSLVGSLDVEGSRALKRYIEKDLPSKNFRTLLLNFEKISFIGSSGVGIIMNLYDHLLDDGSKVKVKGNEEIEYDGELHTAANLFDALKEGTYGKW